MSDFVHPNFCPKHQRHYNVGPCPQCESDKAKSLVVWNNTDSPIFITTTYASHLPGTPHMGKNDFYIGPGQGIDLYLIGLTLNRSSESGENKE